MDDILQRADQRLATAVKRLDELARERAALAEAYNRYVENTRITVRQEQTAKAVLAFLGQERVNQLANITDPTWEGLDWAKNAKALREKAALWEHMDQYLQMVPEAPAEELLAVFERLGIAANRQAIESAVRKHPDLFGMRKDGRDRYFYRKELA